MLSTYAMISNFRRDQKAVPDSGTVKVSRSLKELGMRACRRHGSIVKVYCGTGPTLSQLAEELNEPTENITLAIQAAQPAMSPDPGK